MLRPTQPSVIWPTEYAEALRNKAFRRNRASDEYVLKGIFIERFSKLIGHSMQSYWGSRKNATVQDLARHAILLMKFQLSSSCVEASCHRHDGYRSENSGHRGGNAQALI